MRIAFFVFVSGLLFALAAPAASKHANPATYRQALKGLAPGDTLTLAAGIYERGLPLENCQGSAEAWITIQGPADGIAEIRQNQSANCVELWHCQYLALKKLHLQGTGISGQFGISAKGGLKNNVHHILIEDCLISDFKTSQQSVGISTKTPTWNWIIRSNTIRRCGTGLYLGNSNGHDPFIHGLIEHNLVHDPIGYCMEIKFQNPRPELPGLPTTPGITLIRHNVFIKNDDPSPDGDRPNLLVGGFPDQGPGAADRYEIYGNFFHHNPRESLLQASGRVSIHDNLFSSCPHPDYAAIRLAAHDLPLKLAHLYHNTIVTSARGISIASLPSEGCAIVGNVIFADTPLTLKSSCQNVRDNNLSTIADAKLHLTSPDAALGRMDLTPKPKQGGTNPIDLSTFANETDFDRDFIGNLKGRQGHRGAFSRPSKGSDWKPSQTLKPRPQG